MRTGSGCRLTPDRPETRWGSRARPATAVDLRGAAPAAAGGGARRPGAALRRRPPPEPAACPAGARSRRRDRGAGCLRRGVDQLGELVVGGVVLVLLVVLVVRDDGHGVRRDPGRDGRPVPG